MGKLKEMVLQLFATKSVKAQPMSTAQEKFLSFTGLTSVVDQIKAKFAEKSRLVSASLPETGWIGEDSHTITISVPDITVDTMVEIMVSEDANIAQKTAWAEAGIVSGSTGTGTVSLEAIGEAPKIDIPVTLIVRGD